MTSWVDGLTSPLASVMTNSRVKWYIMSLFTVMMNCFYSGWWITSVLPVHWCIFGIGDLLTTVANGCFDSIKYLSDLFRKMQLPITLGKLHFTSNHMLQCQVQACDSFAPIDNLGTTHWRVLWWVEVGCGGGGLGWGGGWVLGLVGGWWGWYFLVMAKWCDFSNVTK